MKLFREQLAIDEGPFSGQLRHAATILDGLHRCPLSESLPVVMNRSSREDGLYQSRGPRPVRIVISRAGTHPALTLIHEVAHLLDHTALNPIRRGFGSEHDFAFQPLKILWRNSQVVDGIARLLKRRNLSAGAGRFARYKLYNTELWARTYVQWVTVRSADPMLMAQLELDREEHKRYPGFARDVYWDGDDLNAIMHAVDNLFHESRLV